MYIWNLPNKVLVFFSLIALSNLVCIVWTQSKHNIALMWNKWKLRDVNRTLWLKHLMFPKNSSVERHCNVIKRASYVFELGKSILSDKIQLPSRVVWQRKSVYPKSRGVPRQVSGCCCKHLSTMFFVIFLTTSAVNFNSSRGIKTHNFGPVQVEPHYNW